MATFLLLAAGVTAGPLMSATSMEQLIMMRQKATEYLTRLDEKGDLLPDNPQRALQSKGPSCGDYTTEADCTVCHVDGVPCKWSSSFDQCDEVQCQDLLTETDCTAGFTGAEHFKCKWLGEFTGDDGICMKDSCDGLASADCKGAMRGENFYHKHAYKADSPGFYYCAMSGSTCTATLCSRADASSDFDSTCGITFTEQCSELTTQSDCDMAVEAGSSRRQACRWQEEFGSSNAMECETQYLGEGSTSTPSECAQMTSDIMGIGMNHPNCNNFVSSTNDASLCTPGDKASNMFSSCSECREPVCEFITNSDACFTKKAESSEGLTDAQKYGSGDHCKSGDESVLQEACNSGFVLLGMLAALLADRQ